MTSHPRIIEAIVAAAFEVEVGLLEAKLPAFLLSRWLLTPRA